jgi:hypothetical protein
MHAFALALLLLAAPASAATIVLDFEEEARGHYYEGSIVSAECGCVRISDLAGRELTVFDFYLGTRMVEPGYKGEGGTLLLEFLVPVVGLSLDFLSFYPNARPIERPIDYFDAHLIAYSGGEIVGETTLTPDPNGPLFQTISLFPGTVIEQARFVRVALGYYEPISPFIDNIVLTTVPEPGTLGLGALVLLGASTRPRLRLRRKRVGTPPAEGPLPAPSRSLAVRIVILILALWVASPAAGATIVLDFEEEPLGDRGNTFASAECGGCVEFTGWRSRELAIRLFNGSQVLRIGEEGGSLVIDFLVPVHTVHLDFGNDSNSPFVEPGSAILIGLRGGEVVGFSSDLANRNGLIDQTLSLSGGGVIEQVFFAFSQSGEFEPISPIVDGLTFVTVPEPGTLGLAALVLAGAAGRSRIRRGISPQVA